MATVVRVKRSCTDEPLDSLIIACKKQKTSDDALAENNSEDLRTVLKFAGTVQNQDNAVEQIAKTLHKDQFKHHLEETFKRPPKLSDTTAKTRLQMQQNSKENRYKVVNCFRSLDPNIKELDENGMTVIEVEDSGSRSSKEASDHKDTDYVYDLYVSKTTEDIQPDSYDSLVMYPPTYEYIDGMLTGMNQMMYRDMWEETEEVCESEDSNSESNWRNDYPDEEEDEEEDRICSENSLDEKDIINAMSRVRVDGEDSDLSDDAADEAYVYAVDDDDMAFSHFVKQMYGKHKFIDDDECSDNSDNSGVYISEVNSDEENENDGDSTNYCIDFSHEDDDNDDDDNDHD